MTSTSPAVVVNKDLYEFLQEAELEHYYNTFKTELKINNVSQLKYVEEEDLVEMGMSKPEIRRLRKFFKKECPQGALGKIKKKISMRSGQAGKMASPPTVHRGAPQVKASKHIIPADAMSVQKTLGTGEFGTVQQGIWTNEDGERIQVAIKCVSKERMQHGPQDFLKEATVMHAIDHDNIVRMYGVVLDRDRLMLVTELAPLRSLLECLKDTSLRTQFPVTTLCDFALQVSEGMNYLEGKRLIHRDLAARNILVFSKDRIKIGDFGLSRALGLGKDYYQTNFNVNLKLPIAWCAPECINYLKFTSSSDVWAFGVTVWEMFSYGFQPWAAMTGQQILDTIDEPNCQRLEQPDCCPKDYYEMMLKCWAHNPEERPAFADLMFRLPQLKPEQVKAVKDSPANLSSKDYLEYRTNDIITVLDKKPPDHPDLYKGCLATGKTGLFQPGDVVPYYEEKIVSPVYRKTKINRRESARRSGRKTLNRDMISGPQNDLRHTGHIGYDGAMFGDIAFIGDNYDKLPMGVNSSKKGTMAMNGSLISLPQNMDSSSSSPSPIHLNTLSSSEVILRRDSDEGKWSDTLTDVSSSLSVNTLTGDDSDSTALLGGGRKTPTYEEMEDDFDFGDFKVPDMSMPSSAFDLGPSFMDEVFKALSDNTPTDEPEKPSTSRQISHSSYEADKSEPSSPVKDLSPPINGHEPHSRLKKLKQKLGKSNGERIDDGIPIKPMSAADEREIDHAIALANELDPIGHRERALLSPPSRTDSESGGESPKSKSNISLKFPSLKKSNRPDRPSFSDEFSAKTDEDVPIEAQEAYNLLVARGRESSPAALEKQLKPRSRNSDSLSASDVDTQSNSSTENRGVRGLQQSARLSPRVDSSSDSGRSNSRSPMTVQTVEHAAKPTETFGKVADGKSFISAPIETKFEGRMIGRTDLKPIGQARTEARIRAAGALSASRRPVPDPSGENRSAGAAEPTEEERNPLRMLRSGNTVFKPSTIGRGATRKYSYDEQTRTSSAASSYPRKYSGQSAFRTSASVADDGNDNPLPLPPRDRSRPAMFTSKPRQRKYPLANERSNEAEPQQTLRQNGDNSQHNASSSATAAPTSSEKSQSSPNSLGNFSAEQLGFLDDLDSFWTDEVKFDGQSYEDLVDFSLDKNDQTDEVRLMQRVLGNEVTDDECVYALNETKWNVHNAIKFIKLHQLYKLGIADILRCKQALMECSWNVPDAAELLIENPLNSPECVDV
ncbi:activated Cdc42 kinase-like isoform X2 [Tubulanus polymorphus]|uniref:activated Cdc42 kinase-like isoform X2 n=1 Tax=Tubulanus polymorphus TaxID=672921 RepID=UPI003DA545DB